MHKNYFTSQVYKVSFCFWLLSAGIFDIQCQLPRSLTIFLAIDSFFYFQAALVLSKISPEIVGEPVEVNRLYDAVNCLMSYMVNISNFFGCCNYFIILPTQEGSCKYLIHVSAQPSNCEMAQFLFIFIKQLHIPRIYDLVV